MINTRAPDGANKLASIDRTLVALLITGVDITVCDIVGIVLKKKYTPHLRDYQKLLSKCQISSKNDYT